MAEETLLLVSCPPGFTIKAVWYLRCHLTPPALTRGLVLAARLPQLGLKEVEGTGQAMEGLAVREGLPKEAQLKSD